MYLSYFALFLRLFVKKYLYHEAVDMGVPGAKPTRRKSD